MENYFILLELPFDPPEKDADKIKEAISDKQAQWSREQSNPVKKAKASEYLANLSKIKKVMLDPAARHREAEKARQIKESQVQGLKKKLVLYHAKSEVLSKKDLKRLTKRFGLFGFSAEEIKRLFAEVKDEAEAKLTRINFSEVLNKTQAKSVQNFLQQLDMPGKSLYDFLELNSESSCEQLCEAADSMTKKILAKGEKTGRDNAIQSLCGLCVVIFKDTTNKKKYDNYVSLTKYRIVNENIDELAVSNKKNINSQLKESLIDLAVNQYQISVSEAVNYINQYCEYMGYFLPENQVICGLCATQNPVTMTNCLKCAEPLVISCPVCSLGNDNSAQVCVECGFDLTQMDKAIEILRQAKQKYAAKALNEAERLIKEANVYWPDHVDGLDLEKAIQAERQSAAKTIAAIMQEIQKKNMYAAQTKISQLKAQGFNIDDSIVKQVNEAIREVETKLEIVRDVSGDEAFTVAMPLTKLVADSVELNQILQNLAPVQVPVLNSKIVGNEVVLTWNSSPSVGEIIYRVVRGENSFPNDPNDGMTIYSGIALACTDRKAPKNTVLYYSIFAVRAGVYSIATRLEKEVAIVEPVTDVRAIGGNELVNLSWTRNPAVSEIRLSKFCGYDRPQEESQYENVPCSRLDGQVVNGLTNGKKYWFAVSAGYILNGKTYFSEKSYLPVVPQKAAKPLQDFQVRLNGDIFHAQWSESKWDVILFFAKKKPDYSVGTIYDLNDLLTKYEKIDLNLKSVTEAEFRLDFMGECYIIPGVINAANVILNGSFYFSFVPSVKDISFSTGLYGQELHAKFAWPEQIYHSVLVYRMDDYPTGINDPLAQKIECTKSEYEKNDGIIIPNPATGTFYTEIYAYFDGGEDRVYSKPCRAIYHNEPKKEIFYTLEYKKPSLFDKQHKLFVTIEANKDCVFPGFTIISKPERIPLKRTDGQILCTVEDDTKITDSHTYEFDISPLETTNRLRLFFLNDDNYKSFSIMCKAGNNVS